MWSFQICYRYQSQSDLATVELELAHQVDVVHLLLDLAVVVLDCVVVVGFELLVGGVFVAELGDLLLLDLAAEVIAGRYLDDLVDAGVVVDHVCDGVQLLEVVIEGAGVEGKVDRGLVVDPVGVQVLELGEHLGHLPPKDLDAGVEELLDAVAGQVQEHRQFFEAFGAGGLVDVDDVGEYVVQVEDDVGADTPLLDLLQEVAQHAQLVGIEHEPLHRAPQQPLQRELEVVLPAGWHLDNLLDHHLGRRELRDHVLPVQLRVLRHVHLQPTVQDLLLLAGLLYHDPPAPLHLAFNILQPGGACSRLLASDKIPVARSIWHKQVFSYNLVAGLGSAMTILSIIFQANLYGWIIRGGRVSRQSSKIDR